MAAFRFPNVPWGQPRGSTTAGEDEPGTRIRSARRERFPGVESPEDADQRASRACSIAEMSTTSPAASARCLPGTMKERR